MANYNWRDYIVVSYDLDGNISGVFSNSKVAADKNGLSPRHIEKCLRGIYETSNGLMWRRYPKNIDIPQKIEKYIKTCFDLTNKSVLKLNEDGQVLEVYSSIRNAAIKNKTTTKSIRECLKGHQRKAGGYCWKLKD